MSNDLTTNPIVIDTPGTAVLLTSNLYVQSVRWVITASGTAGEQAVITDKDSKVVWEAVNTLTGGFFDEEAQLDMHKPWKGLRVPTLGHGKLYITLKHAPPAI